MDDGQKINSLLVEDGQESLMEGNQDAKDIDEKTESLNSNPDLIEVCVGVPLDTEMVCGPETRDFRVTHTKPLTVDMFANTNDCIVLENSGKGGGD